MDLHNQYYLFADESVQDGTLFSNFYGGALVPQPDYEGVRERLIACKQEHGFQGDELKWQKVTARDLESYKAMVTAFFAEMRDGKVKMRVMFRNNRDEYTRGLVPKNERYLRLYYQFIKHSFGFRFRSREVRPFRLRMFLDRLPDTKIQITAFKEHVCRLNRTGELCESGILVEPQAISEIDSHDYILLQCVDIVLGAMAFRLNEKHLIKPPGKRIRGKRTRAKHSLYKHIYAEISAIYAEKGVKNYDPKNGKHYKN
ncbi:MAG: DUF3800 domain-containing protein, partial [Akkermansiaceae bacterium]